MEHDKLTSGITALGHVIASLLLSHCPCWVHFSFISFFHFSQESVHTMKCKKKKKADGAIRAPRVCILHRAEWDVLNYKLSH